MYLKQCLVTSNVEFFKGDVQEIIKAHKTIKQWAYILHDKDDTAKHYHIVFISSFPYTAKRKNRIFRIILPRFRFLLRLPDEKYSLCIFL